jgi:predicted peroxiredoxin
MTQESTTPPRSLGICVTTRESTRHVLGLAGAAARVGISTEIFLTGEGVHLVRDRRFQELIEAARVSVCDTGLTDKDFVTQWRNAEMVEHCDRYLIV